jgi:hypothetical protein
MVRDYSKGLIYKICCLDVNIKDIYIGSSINMKARRNKHKHDCSSINRKNYNNKVYTFIRNNGGWNNWRIVVIKNFSCNSKSELEAEEDKIMREEGATLNSNKAIWNIEEYNKKKI